MPFPYGQQNKYETYYKPTCIEGILSCEDICGSKCNVACKKPHTECKRGKLTHDFLHCHMKPADHNSKLKYVTNEYVVASNIKEGKKEYKKTDKILTEKSTHEFTEAFVTDFESYSQHQIELWFLNATKITALNLVYQPKH